MATKCFCMATKNVIVHIFYTGLNIIEVYLRCFFFSFAFNKYFVDFSFSSLGDCYFLSTRLEIAWKEYATMLIRLFCMFIHMYSTSGDKNPFQFNFYTYLFHFICFFKRIFEKERKNTQIFNSIFLPKNRCLFLDRKSQKEKCKIEKSGLFHFYFIYLILFFFLLVFIPNRCVLYILFTWYNDGTCKHTSKKKENRKEMGKMNE